MRKKSPLGDVAVDFASPPPLPHMSNVAPTGSVPSVRKKSPFVLLAALLRRAPTLHDGGWGAEHLKANGVRGTFFSHTPE